MKTAIIVDEDAYNISVILNKVGEIISVSSVFTDSKQARVWAKSKGYPVESIDYPDWIKEIQSEHSKTVDLFASSDAILAVFSSQTDLTAFFTKSLLLEAVRLGKTVIMVIGDSKNTKTEKKPDVRPETGSVSNRFKKKIYEN